MHAFITILVILIAIVTFFVFDEKDKHSDKKNALLKSMKDGCVTNDDCPQGECVYNQCVNIAPPSGPSVRPCDKYEHPADGSKPCADYYGPAQFYNNPNYEDKKEACVDACNEGNFAGLPPCAGCCDMACSF